MDTWYILYGGSSCDGMGKGEYVGRTTITEDAINHFKKEKINPYSTGYVDIITDSKVKRAWRSEDFVGSANK